MPRRRIPVTKEQLQDALNEAKTARAAAIKLGLSNETFKRRCKELDIYVTNQGKKGISRPWKKEIHDLTSIGSIKRVLVERGRKYECVHCGTGPMWNGKPLTLQLDHINGKRGDNREENLRFLCPNCHTQTSTWGRQKQSARGGTVDTPV